ncbi:MULTISPECIES: RluA family pseudouridine synthase [unclassified Wenzhouxiangella]|uniref:RluA family pseudouridine synthase n=1 Tax=unclassified Wenzhouxiangella TaxID=2613841 RepID=UPI000E32A990|nr:MULTISPECIES: RluA family pseudouridine synthase [unclassified Wenzhouxiangella]RFF28241.1 RluA family pseudouridine synthase [Wenzhouxiangella sp. 15181]RFP67916.1 RluA family pseudouridine synthase [Wenzhouxiangella sp. 15190]
MHDRNQGRSVRHVTVSDDRSGQRLDNFLMSELGSVPRGLVYRLVRTGQVRINGRRAKPMKKLEAGDEVRIPPVSSRAPEDRRVPEGMIDRIRECIIEQNDQFIVLDKPAGVAVQSGSGLQWGLIDVLARMGEGYRPVHRIDRATSGVLVVARNHRAARELQRAFSGQAVEKRYLALLTGELAEAKVTVTTPLKKIRDASGQRRIIAAEDGQSAVSHFELLERVGGYSYVEVRIETGRTHQIRAHAASIDHPLAGDERYNQHPAPPGLKRLFLHAHCLKLPWPSEQVFSAPLPDELTAVLERLRSGTRSA